MFFPPLPTFAKHGKMKESTDNGFSRMSRRKDRSSGVRRSILGEIQGFHLAWDLA
jgi:hypothetical protein